MNKEKELIKLIASVMPRTRAQLNKLYESDSEIIRYKNNNFLFTIDEFSQEDMLAERDPNILGWNLAVGGISDILATGGKPLFYAHSLVINRKWTKDYIKLFCQGVAAVLKKSKIFFIGGDFGKSEVWRYTVVVIGKPITKPILRTKAAIGDLIYLSGKVGTGNLEAVLTLHSDKKELEKIGKSVRNRFRLRIKEAVLINRYATSCIDTSDGVFHALNTLAEMSNKGYATKNLPYIRSGLLVTKLLAIPKTILFLGECGEYELLFTIKKEDENKFLFRARKQNLRFFKIGQITKPGIKTLSEDHRRIDLNGFNIRARSYQEINVYLKKLVNFLKRL